MSSCANLLDGHTILSADFNNLCGVTCDQDRLPLREKMADQIADCVSFSGSRRLLHQNRTMLLKPLSNLYLLRTSSFAEQYVQRFTIVHEMPRIGRFVAIVPFFCAHHAQSHPESADSPNPD